MGVRLVRVHRAGAEAHPPLLLIAGGPGQSGVDNAAALAGALPSAILDRFDVIGFDPRGVGRSDPIGCGGRATDLPILDLSTPEGYAAATTAAGSWARACSRSLGDRARHYSTAATAEEIEAIRVALGVDRLRYVGWSYGARLGAEYARRHADRVEAAVLDAPTEPGVPWVEVIERQVRGFEASFARFVAWCRGRAECAPLGDVPAFVRALVQRAGRTPLPSARRSDRTPTTGEDVLQGVVAALYDDARWPDLASSLAEASTDSGGLRALAEVVRPPRPELDEPPDRTSQAQFVINCNDTGRDPTEAEVRAVAARMVREDPTFGVWGGFDLLGCAFWDVPRTALAVPPAATRNPIVVVGTRHDPATPYAGVQTMARVLGMPCCSPRRGTATGASAATRASVSTSSPTWPTSSCPPTARRAQAASESRSPGEDESVILPAVRDPRFVTVRRGGSLTDEDHRLLALWAADCAEHVLPLFEAVRPEDPRPREAIEAVRAWTRGELAMMGSRAAGGHAMGAARPLVGAARNAAYAAGQAGAVAHVAAHELGAAAYAIRAVRSSVHVAEADAAGRAECRWQREQLPQGILELVLDDQRLRNDLCWGVFAE